MKHVVHFSGGLVSFWAAHRVIEQYGAENVVLLFADTGMEDEDLYRFNADTEKFFGIRLTILSDGRTPWDLMEEKGMLGNSRFPICSVILKRELLDKWRKENAAPETHRFYLGMDWTEAHRMHGVGGKPGMAQIFQPFSVEAPMQSEPLWSKRQMQDELARIGIKLPRLYTLGFPHNNCGGFCVKAGQAHFAHLLKMMPERYAFHEEKERQLRGRIGKDYSILNDRSGDRQKKTLTLEMLRRRIESSEAFDELDWGGCGCGTSPDQLEFSLK